MKSLAAAFTALSLVLPAAAFAQDVPAEAATNLWCGVAFAAVVAAAPADLTEEQKAQRDRFVAGSQTLIDTAKPVYLENGFTEESFTARVEELNVSVAAEISSQDNTPTHSFEECAKLIGM